MQKESDKFNCDDLTFLIPVRIDTVVRLENLQIATDYLLSNFQTNIIIMEADEHQNGILRKVLSPECTYYYIKDTDKIFHATKYRNMLTSHAITSYIAIWDSDVIVPKEQIIKSLQRLRNNDTNFILPYGGLFLDTGVDS